MTTVVRSVFLSIPFLQLLVLAHTHALTFKGEYVSRLVLGGQLWCSANGSACSGCIPLASMPVYLLVNGTTVIATTATSLNGSLVLTMDDDHLGSIPYVSNLSGRVVLPVDSCPHLSDSRITNNIVHDVHESATVNINLVPLVEKILRSLKNILYLNLRVKL